MKWPRSGRTLCLRCSSNNKNAFHNPCEKAIVKTGNKSVKVIINKGATQTFSKTLTMKRNVMTTVNISVIGSTAESSVGVNEENTPMGNTTVNVSFYAGS